MKATHPKNTRHRGKSGENAVCRFLFWRGYRILERNFTVKGGEIDIIATRFRYIVFVEVKTRSMATDIEKYGRPADSITEEKKAHLHHAASRYLATYQGKKKPRFDVAEVYLPKENQKGIAKIRYIKEAF